jgi:hypothetical protein
MRHVASRGFWSAYDALPETVRALADRNFDLLKSDPRHASLRLKKIGRAVEIDGGLLWFWIGSHAACDELMK